MVEAKGATPKKTEPAEQGTVVATKPSHKRVMILVVVVVVLVAAAVAFGVWKHQQNEKNAAAAATKQLNHLTAQANGDKSAGQFNDTASALLAYARTTSNRSQQITAYANAAASYFNSGQHAKVLDVCTEAIKADGQTFALVEMCAYAAQALGDTSTTIQYYQDALRLVPVNMPARGDEINSLNMAIKQLQGKQ